MFSLSTATFIHTILVEEKKNKYRKQNNRRYIIIEKIVHQTAEISECMQTMFFSFFIN